MTTWDILLEAFDSSSYLHRVGTGDVQSLDHVLAHAKLLDTDEAILTVTGAIMAISMGDSHLCRTLAERLVNPPDADLDAIGEALDRAAGDLLRTFGDFAYGLSFEGDPLLFVLVDGKPDEAYSLSLKEGRLVVDDPPDVFPFDQFTIVETFTA